ncbi:MAG: NnrS family protein [Psychromonas sp.]|nr:NnrS family protein [Alteromonadales bacterium]MCP5077887.1 NnrS family protein [Psychromonas sp.]
MISHIYLGHTGRPLMPSKWVGITFIAIVISGLIRVTFPYLMPDLNLMTSPISILFWCSAFALFVLFYSKILLATRLEQRLG